MEITVLSDWDLGVRLLHLIRWNLSKWVLRYGYKQKCGLWREPLRNCFVQNEVETL